MAGHSSLTGTEGFGARLLALQDDDGQWAGGAYFPKTDSDWQNEPGQPWNATTWSLNALRWWGVDPRLLGDTAERLDRNSRWEYDDLPYWGGEVDVCINAFTLQNGAWLGADVSAIATWFEQHLMPDGGYNCEWENGSVKSSFHSTLNALFALLDYEKAGFTSAALIGARRSAEEYLLKRRLMYRAGTRDIVGPFVTNFAGVPRHAYSALRALDYFRKASLWDGQAPDERMADAIELVRSKRQPDGTWLNDYHHAGREWFEIDDPVGEPSRFVTLQGTRVLNWWDENHRHDQ